MQCSVCGSSQIKTAQCGTTPIHYCDVCEKTVLVTKEAKLDPFEYCEGFDLDGTLANHESGSGIDDIGEPVPKMLKLIKKKIADGTKCIIFTARANNPKNIPKVKAWLKKHGLGNLEVTNRKVPGMRKLFDDIAISVETNTGVLKNSAVMTAAAPPPRTGSAALEHALNNLDIADMEARAKAAVRGGQVSKRDNAVKILNILEGLKRNNVKPSELMISRVPVIPPGFRPFSMLGSTFVPGDANELYKDLSDVRDTHAQALKMFGPDGAGEEAGHLYGAVKALYGYGDPVKPKTAARGVSGFIRQIVGSSPKFGVVQRRLISKPQDSVSRGVITIDADLGMDEIGVPKDQAWTMYAPYIQRRLVRAGMPMLDAVKHVKDRSVHAERALHREINGDPQTSDPGRPVIYSRAPAWHKYSAVAGRVKLIDGDTIQINSLVTTGANADFDGDTINLHLPSSKEAVDEAHNVLMPSKMLFSIRDQNKIVPVPKHEQILGLFASAQRPATKVHQFASENEALSAIRKGDVPLHDEVDYPGSKS